MRKVSFQITWACDIRCEHCCQAHLKTTVDPIAAEQFIGELRSRGMIDSVGFTGGEAFTRYSLLARLMGFCMSIGLTSTVVTNARWALTAAVARQRLSELAGFGLTRISVSYDSFHAKFVPKECIEHVLESAIGEGVDTVIYAAYSSGEPAEETDKIIDEIATAFPKTRIDKRSALPVGYGASLVQGHGYKPISELNLRCPNDLLCAVWPDGRVFPCCSSGTHERLAVGTIQEDIDHILDRLSNRTTLRTLKSRGVAGLLEDLPVKKRHRFAQSKYSSPCQVCFDLHSDPSVAAALAALEYPKDLVKIIVKR